MEDPFISISEFRRNTKVILDGAKHKPVIIRRGDEFFELSWKGSVWQGIPRETVITSQAPPDVKIESLLNTPTPKKIEAAPNLRTPQDVLDDIEHLEDEIEQEARYNQDEESRDKIIAEWKADIRSLWAEYHKLKATQ